MATPLFEGVCASTITPFTPDGQLNLGVLPAHIDWIIRDGANAISPLGSSGEFTALEVSDRKRLLDAVVAANNGRVPVLAGTHHYSTRLTVELSRHAEQAGANGLLIVPPYYMAPTPAQVMDHFRRIAEAVRIPVYVYHNIPLTAVDLRTDHLLQLFEEGAIAGCKMSNPEPDRIVQLLQTTNRSFVVFCGIDNVAFEGLAHGAHGWISGIPSMVPGAARKLYEAIAIRSDLPAARELWKLLAPLMRLQFSAYHSRGEGANWFSVMKAALNMIGPPVGDPCPPILPLPTQYREPLAQMLSDLGYECKVKS